MFSFRSIVNEIEEGENCTTFRKICPPQLVDRKVAARKFTVLLGKTVLDKLKFN